MPIGPLILSAYVVLAAAAVSPPLERAAELYRTQQFAEALDELVRVRQRLTLSQRERLQLLDLLARCQLAERDPVAAQATYEALLNIDPLWEPEATASPKILDVFLSAKRNTISLRYVRLRPQESAQGPPDALTLELIDPWHQVVAIELAQQACNERKWKRTSITPSRHLTHSFPRSACGEVRWYAEARTANGELLGQHASRAQPAVWQDPRGPLVLTTTLPGPAEPSTVWRKQVGWGAAALAVGAGVAAVVMQVQSNRSLERAQVDPWTDGARTLHQQAESQATAALVLGVSAGVMGATAAVLIIW